MHPALNGVIVWPQRRLCEDIYCIKQDKARFLHVLAILPPPSHFGHRLHSQNVEHGLWIATEVTYLWSTNLLNGYDCSFSPSYHSLLQRVTFALPTKKKNAKILIGFHCRQVINESLSVFLCFYTTKRYLKKR